MMETQEFTPGNLVHARNRDWIVLSGSSEESLELRPLSGSDDAVAWISPEIEEVKAASFPIPSSTDLGSLRYGSLFRTAANLRLFDGAGPFRCFGHIAIEPRAYQIVPLLMAMKLDPVRLLIADDVGIGKTIEAGLIARELWDRGEIQRIAVLCPPHLVDQWVGELREHFNLPAEALTASTVYRLEKTIPSGESIHDKYPVTVVSLDYIKTPGHRDRFLSNAPEFIIVDEAHTCVNGATDMQLRYNLLKALVDDSKLSGRTRHLVMLTATPHSGDSVAFGNLLGLLDKRFYAFGIDGNAFPLDLRNELGLHFVQRRRIDIQDTKSYHEQSFPRRMTKEVNYGLTSAWESFLNDVRDYCKANAERYEKTGKGSRVIWYAVLSLFRCVASSPASAISALSAHGNTTDEDDDGSTEEEMLVGGDTYDNDMTGQDGTPSVQLIDNTLLSKLRKRSQEMLDEPDPKFDCLLSELKKEILKDAYRPVIFCKYISTAEYVGKKLKDALPKCQIDVVTGKLTPSERQEHVEAMAKADNPILVATDCLSEGINLQQTFNAVIHYDLAWNPTRHEQREGRVDRFGQASPEVRCVMLWGKDNPVDGFILNVIIRKAAQIRSSLGVLVPVPENNNAICQALVKAAFFKGKATDDNGQLTLGLEDTEVKESFEKPWQDSLEKMKLNRTIFAQRGLHPEEVIPKWDEERRLLGDSDDVRRFIASCLSAMGESTPIDGKVVINPSGLAPEMTKQLSRIGITKSTPLAFCIPAPKGSLYVHRTSPLVSLFSSFVVEDALANTSGKTLGARCSVTETSGVEEKETVFLLRLRHQIVTETGQKDRYIMAEEVVLLVSKGNGYEDIHEDEKEASRLFSLIAEANLGETFERSQIQTAITAYSEKGKAVDDICVLHANALLEEHRGVRDASGGKGQVTVRPCLPPDLLGVYVLVPSIKEL